MFGFISVSRFLTVVFSVFLLGPMALFAQQRNSSIDIQEWPEANVVLFSGDTVTGALTFHHQEEIINVHQKDGSLRSFSPVNVDHFIVSNASEENPDEQVFVTYHWDQDKPYTDFKKPTFFQQLNYGQLTLIMRESYVRRDMNNMSAMNMRRFGYYDPYYNSMGYRFVEQIVPLFYLLLPDGEIKTLRNLRKDLPRYFGKKEKEVKEYMKKNRYIYDNMEHLVSIINYYNSLVK